MISKIAGLVVAGLMSVTAFGKTVELDENTVVIRGEFNGIMASQFVRDISKLNTKEVTLFINSGGGSVQALNQMVSFMDAMREGGTKFNCVVEVAASAAFSLTQACDIRYTQPTSILMQHQGAFGLAPQQERRQESFLNGLLIPMGDQLKERDSARLGLTVKQFEEMIRDDAWFYGDAALKANVADEVVHLTCDEALFSKRIKETMRTFFGTLELTFSGCPLIRVPLEVNGEHIINKVERVKNYVEFLENPEAFLKNRR